MAKAMHVTQGFTRVNSGLYYYPTTTILLLP